MAEFYSARGWEIPPLPWTNLSPPFSRIDLILLGHGLNSADIGLALLISQLDPRLAITLRHGENPFERQRAIYGWNLPHIVQVPMNGIAGADQFMPSTRAFLDSLKKRPAPPKTRNPVDYVLMLGQSSVGWVFRTDRPIAEHSHEIFGPRHLGSAVGRTKSLLLELDEAQSKASTEPSDKADLRHDVKQVQGQILTPAMLLDEWKVPSLLGSVIAQDEDGLMIEQELNRRNHIDSTCVDRTPDLAATDRSYVPTFGGMRTTFDYSHTSVLAARDNAQTLVKRLNCKMQRPTKANPTALGPLSANITETPATFVISVGRWR